MLGAREMIDPVMTRESVFENTLPPCPHCGAAMDDATVRLSGLVEEAREGKRGGWIVAIDRHVNVDSGGFADTDTSNLVVECPTCGRPSALVIDGFDVMLFAARTPIDKRFIEAKEEGKPR